MSSQPKPVEALPPEERVHLVAAAEEAMHSAYAPYSNFRVGAALLTEEGRTFTGCNVENASYGLTICAERCAISAAVAASDGRKLVIRAIAVACSEPGRLCSPCGACRQSIVEFGPDAVVLYPDGAGVRERRISELLPDSFVF